MHSFWGVLEWGANTILFVWWARLALLLTEPGRPEHACQRQSMHVSLLAPDPMQCSVTSRLHPTICGCL